MSLVRKIKSLGPGILVTSAFIGPGTVTVCSLAGNQAGYTLLWALGFSIIATIILQLMCSRLGVVSGKGLGEALKSINSQWVRNIFLILTFAAIVLGNAAYEAGNLAGAGLGLHLVTEEFIPKNVNNLIIGLLALLIFLFGSYRIIEKLMLFLVLTMSLVFLITAAYLKPSILFILKGFLVPTFNDGDIWLVIGLIGTTVVPYNLFLHTSASAQRWKGTKDLNLAKFDTIIAILIGGLISTAIIITAASTTQSNITGAADLAVQLEPLLGDWSVYFIALGLFAAGISSSITAPLAAAYAASGIFGFAPSLKNRSFKVIGLSIALIGILFTQFNVQPIFLIQFAQVANGLLLPFLAIFLVITMNNKKILGNYSNNLVQNLGGILVIIVMLGLGIKSILLLIR